MVRLGRTFLENAFPVRGGLTLREGLTLCEDVYATGKLRAFDLVEVNTELARSDREAELTVDAAKHVILAALGHLTGK